MIAVAQTAFWKGLIGGGAIILVVSDTIRLGSEGIVIAIMMPHREIAITIRRRMIQRLSTFSIPHLL